MGSEQLEHCHVFVLFVCLKSINCLFKAVSLNAPGDSNVISRYLTDLDRGGMSYMPQVLSPLCTGLVSEK